GMGIDIEHVNSPESYKTTRDEFNAGIKTLLPRARQVAGNSYPIASIPVSPLHMDLSPSSWQGFPWTTLGRYTDVVMPMAYWPTYCARFSSEPSGECPRGYAEENVTRSRALTGLPVHPVGGVGDRITTDELDRFVTGARAGRMIGCSIYDYRTTKVAFWEPLRRCS
ncbi:MAG TPA: hypothetical protein VM600_08855, partial [Actinomycetota bacterium]|nr:hypothetical protein [Actinomycetota bacterium]